VGRTSQLTLKRVPFFSTEEILSQVEKRLEECGRSNIQVDYLSLVPDGEPALDIHLDALIHGLKQFSLPVAVISNAALITESDVQAALLQADWVSLKMDAVRAEEWKSVNRPHRKLDLNAILDSALSFSKRFRGTLVTETMLVSGVNDYLKSIEQLSIYLGNLHPQRAYLSIPVRPPAEDWVKPPSDERLAVLIEFLQGKHNFALPLFENEQQGFLSTDDLQSNILEITAVHPIRESALQNMVSQSGSSWDLVEKMLKEGSLLRILYAGEAFYKKNTKYGHPLN